MGKHCFFLPAQRKNIKNEFLFTFSFEKRKEGVPPCRRIKKRFKFFCMQILRKCFRLYDTLKGAYKGKMILELGSYKHLAQHGKCLTSPPKITPP